MKHLIALCAFVFSIAAHAEFLSGNDLLSRLTSSDGYDRGVAKGYIMGAHAALDGVNHCTPAGVSLSQLNDIVSKHLKDVPSVRHMSADSHIAYILNKTWPCASKKDTSL